MADAREPPVCLVNPDDLPVFCPNPGMPLWASHPRVYLQTDGNGEARCPYCSTLYRVEGGPRIGDRPRSP